MEITIKSSDTVGHVQIIFSIGIYDTAISLQTQFCQLQVSSRPVEDFVKRTDFSPPGVKLLWRGFTHPLPSIDQVKERVQLYFYHPSAPSWQVIGRHLHL